MVRERWTVRLQNGEAKKVPLPNIEVLRHQLLVPMVCAPKAHELRNIFVKATGREPWAHQIEAVERLLQLLGDASSPRSDARHNFLVQHGTGSGKSWTMALLAWSLQRFRGADNLGYSLVLLLSDRVQLDRQLGSVCGPSSTVLNIGQPLSRASVHSCLVLVHFEGEERGLAGTVRNTFRSQHASLRPTD